VPSARRWARSCSTRLLTSMSSVAYHRRHTIGWCGTTVHEALAYSLRAFVCVSGVARLFAGPGHG